MKELEQHAVIDPAGQKFEGRVLSRVDLDSKRAQGLRVAPRFSDDATLQYVEGDVVFVARIRSQE